MKYAFKKNLIKKVNYITDLCKIFFFLDFVLQTDETVLYSDPY